MQQLFLSLPTLSETSKSAVPILTPHRLLGYPKPSAQKGKYSLAKYTFKVSPSLFPFPSPLSLPPACTFPNNSHFLPSAFSNAHLA